MQLISKFNNGICFLLYFIDTFSKNASIVSLKEKKGITITNGFQNILDKLSPKSSKIWVDKGSEFYNRPMKSWLQDNYIELIYGYLLLLNNLLEP